MNIGVLRRKIREHDSHLSAAEILADLRLGEYKIIDITIDQNGDWYERGSKPLRIRYCLMLMLW